MGLVRIWTKIGRFFGPKANLKHLKHPKHLKHLKHLMWMLELLFCKHFKELGGKIKDGVHKRQDQKGMLLFSGWIDAIDPIDWIDSIGWMRNLCGLPRPTLRGSIPWLMLSPCSASGYAFAYMEIGSSNTPDGLAVVLTSMTIMRIMPEVILVGQFKGGVPEK